MPATPVTRKKIPHYAHSIKPKGLLTVVVDIADSTGRKVLTGKITKINPETTLEGFKKHVAASRGIVCKQDKPLFSVYLGKTQLKEDSSTLENLKVTDKCSLKIDLSYNERPEKRSKMGNFVVENKITKKEYNLRMHRNASFEDIKHHIQDTHGIPVEDQVIEKADRPKAGVIKSNNTKYLKLAYNPGKSDWQPDRKIPLYESLTGMRSLDSTTDIEKDRPATVAASPRHYRHFSSGVTTPSVTSPSNLDQIPAKLVPTVLQITDIAVCMTGSAYVLAGALELSRSDIEEIEDFKGRCPEDERRNKLLDLWVKRKGKNATLKVLAKAFRRVKNEDMVDKIVKLSCDTESGLKTAQQPTPLPIPCTSCSPQFSRTPRGQEPHLIHGQEVDDADTKFSNTCFQRARTKGRESLIQSTYTAELRHKTERLEKELMPHKWHVTHVANELLSSKEVLRIAKAEREKKLSLFCELWLKRDPGATKEKYLSVCPQNPFD